MSSLPLTEIDIENDYPNSPLCLDGSLLMLNQLQTYPIPDSTPNRIISYTCSQVVSNPITYLPQTVSIIRAPC
ncbi:MAG: hypothetical protein AB8B69_11205 [Chitinophagales bacterium]